MRVFSFFNQAFTFPHKPTHVPFPGHLPPPLSFPSSSSSSFSSRGICSASCPPSFFAAFLLVLSSFFSLNSGWSVVLLHPTVFRHLSIKVQPPSPTPPICWGSAPFPHSDLVCQIATWWWGVLLLFKLIKLYFNLKNIFLLSSMIIYS